MNVNKKLPVFGIGPVYVISCLIITVGIYLLDYFQMIPRLTLGHLKVINIIIGIGLIVLGAFLYFQAVAIQRIDIKIKEDKLVIDGVYSVVRNPIYTGITLVFTGILMTRNNLILMILPFLFYITLSLILMNTEEKWLNEKFGDKHREYCSNVNRIIPSISSIIKLILRK